MGFKKCNQKKCSYNQGFIGCPTCPECGAKPHEVCDDDTCIECYCCIHDMGYVRGGVPENIKEAIRNALKQKKEIILEVK